MPKVEVPQINKSAAEAIRPPKDILDVPMMNEAAIALEKPEMLLPDIEPAKQKVSQFKTNTWRNSPILDTEEAQKVVDEIKAVYDVKPNAQTIQRASEEVAQNIDAVMNRIRNAESINSAEDAAASGIITNMLRQQAEATGDYTKLNQWLKIVQPKVTATAQGLQAISTWKKLTPEGALMKFEQLVGQANREAQKKLGNKAKIISITPDDTKFIVENMKNLQSMPGNTDVEKRAKDVLFGQVKKYMADKIPSSWVEKIKAIQRINLLLNPKTMVRNTLGNVFMGAAEDIKDIPGTAIDKLVSLGTGKRTTTLPIVGIESQAKGMGRASLNQ
jgi:hypothetical protein